MKKFIRLLWYTGGGDIDWVLGRYYNPMVSMAVAAGVGITVGIFFKLSTDTVGLIVGIGGVGLCFWNNYAWNKYLKRLDRKKVSQEFAYVKQSNKNVYYVLALLTGLLPTIGVAIFIYLLILNKWGVAE